MKRKFFICVLFSRNVTIQINEPPVFKDIEPVFSDTFKDLSKDE